MRLWRVSRVGRRWWQRAIRWTAVLALLLAAAYVTLPWWAPTGWLRAKLAEEMARQMGVPVRIDDLSLRWGSGVEIRGLTIDSPEGFGPEPLAIVERIHADFSPLDFIVHKRLAYMELHRPRLFARRRADGRFNVAPLLKLKFDVEPERLTVHEAFATLELLRPDGERGPRLRLNVSDLQLHAGEVNGVGRVTMSAALQQSPAGEADGPSPGLDAPVSLHLTDRPTDIAAAATASLRFANVDLAQLALPELLPLPLERLCGRCDGDVDLRMNRDGMVDHFTVRLSIRELDVQPVSGPQLPVIDRAGLDLSAAVDPFAHPDGVRVDVQSASVRLTGVELSGQARVLSPADGSPPQIESLSASGTVYPRQVAALLTGRQPRPDELTCEGPVRVESVSIGRDGPAVAISLRADAERAVLRRGRHTLKPRGRALRVEFDGSLDDRDWTLSVTQATARLGENSLRAEGTFGRVDTMLDRLGEPAAARPGELLDELHILNSRGEWHIEDLAALRDLSPSWARQLAKIELEGRARGTWEVRGRDDQATFHAELVVPAESGLAVGETFVKPDGAALRLGATGQVLRRGPARRDRDVDVILQKADLGVGAGRLHADGVTVRIRHSPGGAATGTLRLDGRFDLKRLDALAACLPPVAETGVELGGGLLHGRCEGQFGPDSRWLELAADVTDASAELPGRLRKPAGLRTTVVLRYDGRDDAPTGERHRASVELSMSPEPRGPDEAPALRLKAGAQADQLAPQALAASCEGTLHLRDVGADWLARTFALPGTASWADRLVGVCADGRIHLATRGDGAFAAEVRAEAPLTVALRRSRLSVAGQAVLDLREASGDAPGAAQLVAFDANVSGDVAADESMRSLLPDLSRLADRVGLAGRVSFTASVQGDERGLHVRSAELDATRLSVADAGGLTKPAGLPATARLRATLSADASQAWVDELTGAVGDLAFEASGSCRFGNGGMHDLRGRFAVETERGETLRQLVPSLREYRPRGPARVEGEWRGDALVRATLTSDDLRFAFDGRELRLRGTVTARDVRPRPDDWPVIGDVATDGLEVILGEQKLWFVAEVADPTRRPTGAVRVMAETLDSEALRSWAAGAAAAAATKPADDAETPDQRRIRAQRQATKAVDALREVLAEADLAARVSIGHVRAYDASVDQYYDARQVEATGSAKRGELALSYTAGLNGGTMSGEYAVNFVEDEPVVRNRTEYRDILATENFQPQIEKFFPGNKVQGLFNRTEQTTAPLAGVLASALGSPEVVHPAGKATTLTTDGIVTGRAAPAYVTRIFPSLNLTKYRYHKMTGFAKLNADGSAGNDMIFEGRIYDLYIEGATGPDHIGKYRVGVILLASPQSAEWNHRYKLGRIALMNFQARIEGGKMYDVKVSYLRPDEIIGAILLTNNPLYHALFSPTEP